MLLVSPKSVEQKISLVDRSNSVYPIPRCVAMYVYAPCVYGNRNDMCLMYDKTDKRRQVRKARAEKQLFDHDVRSRGCFSCVATINGTAMVLISC